MLLFRTRIKKNPTACTQSPDALQTSSLSGAPDEQRQQQLGARQKRRFPGPPRGSLSQKPCGEAGPGGFTSPRWGGGRVQSDVPGLFRSQSPRPTGSSKYGFCHDALYPLGQGVSTPRGLITNGSRGSQHTASCWLVANPGSRAPSQRARPLPGHGWGPWNLSGQPLK